MKKKMLLTGFLLLVTSFFFINNFSLQEATIETYVKDTGALEVYFCPGDCEPALVDFLDSAEEKIHCALFEVDLDRVREKLLEKNEEMEVQIVTDNDYLYEFNHSFVKTDTWGLMHNKFCIIDDKKISTGSMNPTNNGANKNNNNLVLIYSVTIANNYEAEFQEMWNGTFKKGAPVKNPSIMVDNISLQNYFCPDDDCEERVKDELKKAEESIRFMTFSFTNEGIANILLLKHTDGIIVEGVMEARQVTKYSQFERLKYNGIDVIKDGNKQNMHHKVFIIDEQCVITGSMNPTAGGNSRNDENVLVICDEDIAQLYLDEYKKIRAEAES